MTWLNTVGTYLSPCVTALCHIRRWKCSPLVSMHNWTQCSKLHCEHNFFRFYMVYTSCFYLPHSFQCLCKSTDSWGCNYCLSEWRIESTFKQKYPYAQAHYQSNTWKRNIGWLFSSPLVFLLSSVLSFLYFKYFIIYTEFSVLVRSLVTCQ
jgi:hypothetical protein